MSMHTISTQDEELIEAARNVIKKHFRFSKHHIGVALRTKSNKIITAVNLEVQNRRADVCAEAIALGKAIAEGDNKFDTIVAVRHPFPYEKNQEIRVVPPCGICRELISAYCSNIKVIIPSNDILVKYDISDLLPFIYSRK